MKVITIATLMIIYQFAISQITEDKFTIRFPGESVRQVQQITTEAGEIDMITYMYEKSSKEVYMMAYSDYPESLVEGASAKNLLNGAKEGFLEQLDLKIEHEKEIDIKSHAGISIEANNKTYFVTAHFYLAGSRLYQIAILSTDQYANKHDAGKFFKSFKLLQ